MATIYLDHNVVSSIAGLPGARNAERERQLALALKHAGHRFVLSAWNMYELARSNDPKHIDQCCDFIDLLDPAWVSNNLAVKRQEVVRFLQGVFDRVGPVRSKTVSPFNSSVAQMWATYGGPVFVGETFRNTVDALRADRRNIERIEQAANEAPDAIATARRAVADGAMKHFKFIVDRAYFASLAPTGTPREQIDYLANHIREVLTASPAIAVEETLSQIRLKDSFVPEPADASDLQHAMTPLAYCDYFVTGDKQLHEHCRIALGKLNGACGLAKSIEALGEQMRSAATRTAADATVDTERCVVRHLIPGHS